MTEKTDYKDTISHYEEKQNTGFISILKKFEKYQELKEEMDFLSRFRSDIGRSMDNSFLHILSKTDSRLHYNMGYVVHADYIAMLRMVKEGDLVLSEKFKETLENDKK